MVNSSDKSENIENSKVSSRDFLKSILDTVRGPLLILDTQLRFVDANSNLLELFRVKNKEAFISKLEEDYCNWLKKINN